MTKLEALILIRTDLEKKLLDVNALISIIETNPVVIQSYEDAIDRIPKEVKVELENRPVVEEKKIISEDTK